MNDAPRKIATDDSARAPCIWRRPLALLREGYSVVLAGRRADALQQTVAEAGSAGGGAPSPSPTDVGDPISVQTLFEAGEGVVRPSRSAVQQRRRRGAARPAGRLDHREMPPRRGRQSDRRVPRTQGGVSDHEGPGHLAADASLTMDRFPRIRPRPNSAPYTATKHAITGLTRSTALDGRKHDIACGQIDIGNAGTEMTARMNRAYSRPTGNGREPTMDVRYVARAVLYMAGLPLDANVLFMTVMATKMPFVGRG